MKTKYGIVVFDMALQEVTVYKDISEVAELFKMKRTTLQHQLDNNDILYKGSCFVGRCSIQSSSRGLKSKGRL